MTSAKFDQAKFDSDLKSCGGDKLLFFDKDVVLVTLSGSLIGAASGAAAGAAFGDTAHGAVIGTALGTTLGLVVGAKTAVEKRQDKVEICLRNKGYTVLG